MKASKFKYKRRIKRVRGRFERNSISFDYSLPELNMTPDIIYQECDFLFDQDVFKKHLYSRQVVKISLDNGIKSFYHLFSDSLKEAYDSIDRNIKYDDLSAVTDVYKICEYVCPLKHFTMPVEYLLYLKNSGAKEVLVSIYGAELTEDIPEVFRNYIQRDIQIPDINYNIAKQLGKKYLDLCLTQLGIPLSTVQDKVKYPVFDDVRYNTLEINESLLAFVLNLNVPYEYYSRIPFVVHLFSYDINDKQFYCDEYLFQDLKENHLINDGMENLFKQNVYIDMTNHKLALMHTSNVLIYFAKLFKFPSIPASFVISDGLYESVPINIKHNITIEETEKLCHPYFKFDVS